MADKAKLEKRLDIMVERLADVGPDIAEDWGGTILFKATDLNTGWMMKFAMDGTIESLEERMDEEAATSIMEADSDTLLGIFNGDINPMEARAKGSMRAEKALDPLALIMPACIGPVDL
ncbi:MAG: hypothetical protein EPO21_07515 [Chloroflexota bacterium]|nr:MAG: hypothetical protein EPO21_07515 [Chloroflexota bacterium]